MLVMAMMLPANEMVASRLDTAKVGATMVSASTATNVARRNGWTKSGKHWYYYRNGQVLTGWRKIGGKTYYLSRSSRASVKGRMFTGWQTIRGNRYYFGGANDGVLRTGWQKIGSKNYYFRATGVDGARGTMRTGWQTIKGKSYYFTNNGVLRTGWRTIGGKRYYFRQAGGKGVLGERLQDGTFTIGKTSYRFDAKGILEGKVSNGNAIKVARNIMYAVESGGQVYGNKQYTAFMPAYNISPIEHAITIGAGQWLGVEAKRLLTAIRTADPAAFKRLDKAGIGRDLDKVTNWANYGSIAPATAGGRRRVDPALKRGSAKAKSIQAIINSPVGRKCQDQLMDAQIREFFAAAERLGIKDTGAKIQYANVAHLGGSKVAGLVVANAKKPYTNQSMYAAIMRRNVGNQVGAPLYASRHRKVRDWVNQYL